jgi:cytochrome c-type biogenesis protein CcmH
LPPKPGVAPQLTDLERDALERRIHCQCGCTLDVFTCRTTDFSCRVSPAMHRDVMELVRGGYSAQEILDAFVGVYGERALMAPKKSGFNLLAWVMPGTAVIVAGGVLMVLLRKWGDRARQPHALAPLKSETDATPEELAELEAAVRGEDHQ